LADNEKTREPATGQLNHSDEKDRLGIGQLGESGMKSVQRIRKTIADGGRVSGFLATQHVSPQLVEMAIRAGADYLIVDCEHHMWPAELVSDVCRVGRLADFAVIIRVPKVESTVMRQAADLGPAGIMLPCVESVKELDLVQSCIQVPPRGTRRPGGQSCYWLENFRASDWRDRIEEHFLVLPQIENATGLKNAAGIASHPITTALAIGPYDLSLNLEVKYDWDPQSELSRIVGSLALLGESHDKATWCIGPINRLLSLGIRFLGCGEPFGMMQGSLREAVAAVEGYQSCIGNPSNTPYSIAENTLSDAVA